MATRAHDLIARCELAASQARALKRLDLPCVLRESWNDALECAAASFEKEAGDILFMARMADMLTEGNRNH